jgi:hypothetical protein
LSRQNKKAYIMKTNFKTKSFKRAISAIYSNLDDRDFCEMSWREYVDGDVKTLKRVLRIWEAKNLLSCINRVAFVSLSLSL